MARLARLARRGERVGGSPWRSLAARARLFGVGGRDHCTDRRRGVRASQRVALVGCLVGLCLALAACATPRGGQRGEGVHVVQRGETLWVLSRRYRTTVEALARVNRLRDPNMLRIGQRLRVPALGTPSRAGRAERSLRDGPRLDWPVSGRLSSRFGLRHDAHHDGIDIAAGEGTKIRAAAPGRVVYAASRVSGYGNLIIVRHAGLYSTVYAHNRRNLVKSGQNVTQGQVIAEVGRTGRASGPHLHFEVRHDGRPRNPLDLLP